MDAANVSPGTPDSRPRTPAATATASATTVEVADRCFDFSRFASAAAVSRVPGSGLPRLSSARSKAAIMMGNAPMPSTWRMSCMTMTSGPFAPMAAATMGVSLMPPGTAHMRAVRRSMLDTALIANPRTRLSARKVHSMRRRGRTEPRMRRRSLRSREHPTKAPATICTPVRTSVGSHATPVEMLRADTPTKAPIMYPAGTLILLARSPHAQPTAIASSAANHLLSTSDSM